MELLLKSAEINLPQEIENLQALKDELGPKLEKYNNLVVTADSIKAAKADKAALNKLRAAIEDQRKAIKKQYLEPYNILEAQCKEVVALIDAPITAIDKQIKAFDEIEENAKLTELQEAFEEIEAAEWITLDDVLNPKWRNKTAKTESLIDEMQAKVAEIEKGFSKICEMYNGAPFLLTITEYYKKEKDFSKTAVYAAELNTAYKREQEAKAKAAQQAAQNEPQQPAPVNNEVIPPEAPKANTAHCEQPQRVYKGRFEVEGTAEQIKGLSNYMKANGIKFTVVK